MKKWSAIFTLLLVFVLLAGCIDVGRSVILVQKKAILDKATSSDTDGDGIPNIWHYTFKPQDTSGLSMKKEIYVTGTSRNNTFTIVKYYLRNDTKATAYYNQLSNTATLSLSCIYAIDEVVPCDSEEQCYNLCVSKVRCMNSLNKDPALNGSFYSFSVDFQRVRKDAADLRTLLLSSSSLSQAELDNIIIERDKMKADIQKLLSNPIFMNGYCDSSDILLLQNSLTYLENIYEVDQKAYANQFFNAYSKYEVSSKISFSYDENAVVDVDDTIPESFAKSKTDLQFITAPTFISDNAPFVSRYRLSFKKVEGTKDEIAYKASADPHNWDVEMGSINYPTGTIKVLELESFGPYVAFKGTFTSMLNALRGTVGFGVAFSITLFIFLLILYLLFIILKLLSSVLLSISKREPLIEAVYRVAGIGGRGRMGMAAAGIGALAIGIYLMWGVEPATDDAFNAVLANNNLLVGILFFAIGEFSLYFLASDVIKGLALGDRYYRPVYVHGIRKVLVEKDLRDEIARMRADILSLKEEVAVSGIAADLARVDIFMTRLAYAESRISHGRLDEAESEMEKFLRNEYASLHELLSISIDQVRAAERMRESVEDDIVRLEALYRKALNYNVALEHKNWRDEANKYKGLLSMGGYNAANKHLEDTSQAIKQEISQLTAAIAQVEHLRQQTFLCPVCRKKTSLASPTCENCGIPLDEGFSKALSDFKNEFNVLSREVKDAGITDAEKEVKSIGTLMSLLSENVAHKEFIKASELVISIDEKMKVVEELLGRSKAEVGGQLRTEISKLRDDIIALRESATVAEVAFDAERISSFVKDLSSAESLIKMGRIAEAEREVEKSRQEYASLKESIGSTLDEKHALDKMMADVDGELDILETLYGKAVMAGVRLDRKDMRSEAYKYSSIFASRGFIHAKKHLENVLQLIKKERSAVQSAINEMERLKQIKFTCPVCGRTTSLAFDTCESCGISLEEGFNRRLSDFTTTLDMVRGETKGRLADESAKAAASIEVLINLLKEKIKSKDYVKASELVASIDEKMNSLEESLGRRKATVVTQLRDEAARMRSEVLVLKESAMSAGAPLDFTRIAEFMRALSDVDSLLSLDKVGDAEQMLDTQLRREFEALRQYISVSVDQHRLLSAMVDEMDDELDVLDSLYTKIDSYGIPYEKKNVRAKAVLYKDILASRGFDAAKMHIEEVLADAKDERKTIEKRIAEIEHLRQTKFTCPVCGRTTSLAFDTCESCGTPLADAFTAKARDFRHELESIAMELQGKKAARVDRLVSSVDVLITHLDDDVKSKRFDKAAELVSTINEKIKHLQELLSKMVAMEVEFDAETEAIEAHIESIPALLLKAQEAGIDVSAYEKRFNSLGGSKLLEEIFNLPLDEAVQKGKDLADSYAQIESDLKNTIAKFTVSVNALERVNELFTEASTLITKGKGVGMSLDDYSRRLGGLNIDGLIERIESNEADEKDISDAVTQLTEMTGDLKKRVYGMLGLMEQITAIEDRIQEANRLFEECRKGGLPIFEEQGQVYALDVERLKARAREAKPDEIESIRSEVSAVDVSMNSVLMGLRKKQAVLASWPTWKENLISLLKKQDRVEPAMLVSIPAEWRPWVLEKFVSETDLPVMLGNNAIVKLKSIKGISKADISAILGDMIKTQRILGGVVLRKDGLVISSELPGGRDASAIAAMSARAMQKAEQASSALNKGDVNYMVFNARDGRIIIVKAGEQALVLALIRPDEDLGFVVLTMKKASRKVRELIDKL